MPPLTVFLKLTVVLFSVAVIVVPLWTRAHNLLFITGLGGPGSHFYIGSIIAEELVRRGHAVTFVISDVFGHRANGSLAETFAFEVFPSPTMTRSQMREGLKQFGSNSLDGKLSSTWEWLKVLFTPKQVVGGGGAGTEATVSIGVNSFFASECDSALSDAAMMDRLRDAKFDMVVGDVMNLCFVLIAQKLNIRYVNVMNGLILPMEHGRLAGLPSNPAFLPGTMTRFSDDMSLLQRCLNVVAYGFSAFLYDNFCLGPFDRLKAKHGIWPEMSVYESLGRAELWLMNTNFVIGYSQSLTPNVVLIGGITSSPAKPLDADLESFVEGSGEHGLVVFTLSSSFNVLKASSSNKLAAALARLPQRVLWKFEGEPPATLGNNTKLMKWLPMNDILGHPKTRALITQGGLNSVTEAIYHGVPMVGMPLTGDQFEVLVGIKPRGFVKQVDVVTVTEEEFYQAIVEVLEDKRYKENAVKWSKIFQDKPATAKVQAANWIELVIKYGGAHLRPKSLDLNFFQVNSIDVLLFLAIVGFAVVFLTYYVVRITCCSLCRRRNQGTKVKNE